MLPGHVHVHGRGRARGRVRGRGVDVRVRVGMTRGRGRGHACAWRVHRYHSTARARYAGLFPLTFPSFGLHPFLMTLAFGLLAPWGVISWRALEHNFGVSHGVTKKVLPVVRGPRAPSLAPTSQLSLRLILRLRPSLPPGPDPIHV